MKLPNDLIKATDYSKVKEREIHEFENVNGKVIQHYVLGGEHELTMQEIVDCLNALSTIDCDLQTAYTFIHSQQDKIADLEVKLAESESKSYTLESHNNFLNNQCKKLIKENKKLIKALNGECFINYKVLMENAQLKQQLAEKENIITNLIEDSKTSKELLKKELAEKNEEIAYLTKQVKKFNNEAQKYFEDAYCNAFRNQDKISFCIEQLEKVKEEIDGVYKIWRSPNADLLDVKTGLYSGLQHISSFIDNQIKQLKEENK